MIIEILTLSFLNYSFSFKKLTLETSSSYTIYGDDQNISTLSCLNYSCSNEGLMQETSASYTSYGDDQNISTWVD